MKENIREWTSALISAVAVGVIIVQFVMPTVVSGISMEPAFEGKDYLLISRQAYAGKRAPRRGDVIVFRSHLKDEDGKDKNLIKRVVGLPGESVSVKGGKVYINGEELEEDYLKDGITNGNVEPVIVPEENVFCLGDNRLHSTDSRSLAVGFVDKAQIEGKVFFRVFPFNRMGKAGGKF